MKTDIGLLILRLTAGGLMIANHGLDKLMNFNEKMQSFADPIGLGSGLSLGLAAFAEFFCALLVVLGIFSRFAAIPLAFTMFVAAFIVHADDPWARRELALVYLGMYLAIICLGGGKYSIFKGKSIPSS